MLVVGEVVGGFVIKGPLGRGGMGAVFRAWDPGAGRDVALKLFDVGGGSEGLLRFKREAELAARVDGQGGVVRVHARGVHRGTPFLVLELVEGRDLAAELAAGPIEPARLARIVEEVARALHHCHTLGVVHRDIKPANVLLRAADDAPLLTDFGIARDAGAERLTQTGVLLGTPNYMAPEQALDSSRATDPRVDVYALGAILYHGLAGRAPEHVIARVGRELPPPSASASAGVDASLEAICLRAVAPEPARRHPSAAALADDLARWRGGERAVAGRRRRRALRVVLAAFATALLACAAGHASARHALARAERLESASLSAFLAEPAAIASWSGDPALFVEEARALAARRAFLVGDARDRAGAAVERLEACARLVDEHADAPDAPPHDARARAADALVTARRSGAAAGVLRLGGLRSRDPLVLAVEARLRAETSDAFRTYARWCTTVRDEPLAWSIARPRVLALATRACREAALSTAATTVAEGLLPAVATLDPRLVDEAIEGAAGAWGERLLQAARGPVSRELPLLIELRRLLAAGGAAPGPRVRDAVSAVFVELDARFDEVLYVANAKSRDSARDRLLAWDQATFELVPDLAPPAEHMERLISLANADASTGMPLSFALTCVRRGIELDRAHAWDDLGRAVLASDARGLDPLDPSGAVRLCVLAAELFDRAGGRRGSEAEVPVNTLEPLLARKLVTAPQLVLDAPRDDVSPRYRGELHILAAEALAHLVTSGDLPPAEHAGAWSQVLVHLQAFMEIEPSIPEFLPGVVGLGDLAATRLGRSGEERVALLQPAVDALRAARAAQPEGGSRRGDFDGRLAQTLHVVFFTAVAAGRLDLAFAACRESLEALPPASIGDGRLFVFLSALPPSSVEAFVREFRGHGASDPGFVVVALQLDVAAGRLDEARALLDQARRLNPTHEAWPAAEASLAAPR